MIDGRYALVEALGGSAAGQVFRALDRHLNREVAIRVVGRDDPAASAALARQVSWMTALQYDSLNVVAILDDGVAPDGARYMVMDLVRGMPLDARQAPLEPDRAIRYAIELLDASLAMRRHANQPLAVVPATALTTADGHVRVVRFAETTAEEGAVPDPVCAEVARRLRELLGGPAGDEPPALEALIDDALTGRVRSPDDLRTRLRAVRGSAEPPSGPAPPPFRTWPLVFASILILVALAVIVALAVVVATG